MFHIALFLDGYEKLWLRTNGKSLAIKIALRSRHATCVRFMRSLNFE